MDQQKKRLSTELDKLVPNHHSSQAHAVESPLLPGALNSAKTNASAQVYTTSIATPKKEHIKDSSEMSSGQTHPKKKGGFVITSVKDNVDGDESADDLDESHASYSDVSYSRTTDIDHDQESTASEDTLNLTVQDAVQPSGTINQNHAASNTHHICQAVVSNDQTKQHQPVSHVTSNASAHRPKSERTQSRSTSLDMPQDLPNDASESNHSFKHSQVTNAMPSQGSSFLNTVGGIALTQSSHAPESQQTSHKPTASNSKSINISPSSASVSTTSSAPSVSSSSTPAKGTSSNATLPKGGQRMYKVIKSETGPPVGRDVARWLCYDYGDGQTPNLGFVAQSASDSRLSFQDQLHLQPANQLASSMSATSVPSSSSAYSLQHSDSTSSVNRDGYPHGISIGLNSAVQHSASTSSVNHDLEAKRLLRSVKGAVNEIFNADDRFSGRTTAEQELLKNVIQSSAELSANLEQDDERGEDTKSTGRIDNKIGTVMDLVKKHLMSAVRDEVGELKEKIVELTAQNEALRGVLHPDQIAALQPQQPFSTSGQPLPFQVKATSQGQQLPLYQQQPGGLASTPATLDHTNPPPHSHTSTGNLLLGQKHPQSLNPAGFSLLNQPNSLQLGQTGQSQQSQTLPGLQNQAGGITSAIGHPQQPLPTQQQLLQTQQQTISQLSRPANYQQNQQIFPPTIQPVLPQQQFLGNNSLTPQQMQALLQVAFQQVSGQIPPQPGQMPHGFQQMVMQQSGIQSLGQPAQYQSFQQQVPLQQPSLFQTTPLPQASTPVSQTQGQFQASQQNPARSSAQSSQSATVLPRHQQQQQSASTNQNASHSSLHAHGAAPNPLHDPHQQFTTVQPTNVPAHSGPSQSSNGAVAAEQKPPLS